MGLFGKKKQANTAPIPEPAPLEPTIQEEQQGMKDARVKLDDLIEDLAELQSPAFHDAMANAARNNEATADANRAALDAAKEQNPDTAYKLERRSHLEDDLYIMPPELQAYRNQVDALIGVYQSYSAAESRLLGADEIDPLIRPYIKKFREALEDGQKLKADVCWDVLKYAVFVVHNRAPEGRNDEERRKSLERRKDVIQKTFWAAIQTADKIYGDVASLTTVEGNYEKVMGEYKEADKSLSAIPENYQEEFETLGFSGVLEKYPIGHPIRPFLDQELFARTCLSQVELQGLEIERREADILKLRSQLITFLGEARKRFNEQGETYSEEEVARELNRITEQTIQDINEMYRSEMQAYEMSRRLSSLVAAAANNEEWGKAAVESREHRQLRKDMEKANNDFNRQHTENLNAPPPIDNEPQVVENDEDNRILADMG
ncbi:MAG: hypothetical protein IKQ39_05535 [Oscillospiraceae bacterium]|nr:hypothetical protein [Oscillospiraceae bacterium]